VPQIPTELLSAMLDLDLVILAALHSADAHTWWKKTKQFLELKQPNPFQNLQQHCNISLADETNDFVAILLLANRLKTTIFCLRKYNTGYLVLMCISHHGLIGCRTALKDFASLISDSLAAIFNASL